MKIIGEKINGTRKRVKEAVLGRDAAFIQQLAADQAAAGATWIDVNAGTPTDREPDDLVWLVQTVQAAVKQPPLLNSISGEQARLTGVLPLAAQAQGGVIALAMDDKGIPATTAGRLEIVQRLIGLMRE